MSKIQQRVLRLASKVKTLRNATRLWNLIDHREDSDDLWPAMLAGCPWAFFDDRDANTMQFTY